jgi:integrase
LDTVQGVSSEYMRLKGVELRSAETRARILNRLVFPKWGARPIASITKIDCIRLFDSIASNHGPVMSDHTRAILSRIFIWYEGRHETFRSPITRGIERHARPTSERARTHTLSDDDLRRLWSATAGPGAFPALVRFLLLTGARLNEAACITRSEITDEGDWLLPAKRNKVKRDLLRPLSPQALAVINDQPKVAGCDYVFTNGGRGPLSSFFRAKQRLCDDSGAHGWMLHDLRRTARSLMSRANVSREHAEQCLGHVIRGVAGTYDRHDYYAEKKGAYVKLAAQIEWIVNPPESNVVTLVR